MLMTILGDVLSRTLRGFAEHLMTFLPNLLAMLLLLIVGIGVAGAVKTGLRFLLPRLGTDSLAQRMGATQALRQAGLRSTPSGLAANVGAWTVFAVFVLLSIAALNLSFAMGLLTQGFLYLPQVLVAFAVVVLGDLVARFVRRSVLIAAVNAELSSARALATGAQISIMVFALAIALEHVGVGRQIILAAFTIAFGGVVLALALAFGLAGKDVAREVIDRVAAQAPHNTDADHFKHL